MSHPLLLTACLLVASPGPTAAVAAADREFDEALLLFQAAARRTDFEERLVALERLVDFKNLNAVSPIVVEYGQVAEKLYQRESEALGLRYALERRQVVLENLEQVVARDEGERDRLVLEQEEVDKLETDLADLNGEIRELLPWRDALGGGLALLAELVGPSKAKKVEEVVWTDAEEHPEPLIQRASVELLGRIGSPGTAVRLQRFMAEWAGDVEDHREVMVGEKKRIRQVEKQMQELMVATGGRPNQNTYGSMRAEYNRVKQVAAKARKAIDTTELRIDSAATAGARALSRETGKQLDKSVASLVRALKKNKGRARLNVLLLLSRSDSEAVRTKTRELLLTEKEAVARAELIDGLAAMGDEELVPLLLERFLVEDDSWLVRSRSARALADLRVKEAVPVLIDQMAGAEGRLRTDLEHALISLTGQNYRGNADVWQRWWDDNSDDFEVAEKPPEKSVVEQAREARGVSTVSFFGVATESQKVLFVLDVSGSMEFSMTPGDNPTDDPGRPFDFPEDGDISRLTAAKRDLVKALGGLKEGARFNIVFYASDVWTWADELVEMSAGARDDVTSFVEETGAVGATNIYGALERALELAGAAEDGDWGEPEIDTIYLLTDGRATVGLTTDAEDILNFVRERNRTAGITIHTIGLSAAHDANLLRRLAEQNGGTYVGR